MSQRHVIIGVLQIVSGLVNLAVMAVGWFTLGTTVGGLVSGLACTVLTLGLCPLPIGMLCGLVGILPVLVGVIEIIGGSLVIGLGDQARTMGQVTAVLEILSVFYGGIVSAVVGVVALVLLARKEEPDPTW